MEPVEIEAVDPSGAEANDLVAAFFAAIAERYPGFDPARQPPAPTENFTTMRGGAFLAARMGGQAVGCACLQRLDDRTAEVRRVFVQPSARGRGIGRMLLDALLDSGRAHGYTRLRLDTGDRLPEAVALFRAYGFRDIPDYNGNPFAAYWMELEL